MKLWIARNEDGDLSLFRDKPVYDDIGHFWRSYFECSIGELDYHIFSEVTFENSPREIELKLVEE